MTEEITTPEAETATSVEESPKPTKPTETVEFWKQKAREQEARAKANAEAATKLKEFEDRDKSEADKLAERVTAAEKRALDSETAAMRLEVAAEKGLTPAQAKRLVGSSREELQADADELLTTFTPAKADDSEVITSLDLGTRGTATASTGDPAADFAKFMQKL